MIRVQNSWEMSSRTRQELQASCTMPIDSQSPLAKWKKQKERDSHLNINCGIWMKSVTSKVRQSLKLQWPSVVTRENRYCNRSGFSAHQRVFGSSLRLPGSLLSDDPIDRQLLTAGPHTNFHRANEMRTAVSTSVVQTKFCTCGTNRSIGHVTDLSREKNINAGDTTMVWRNNNLTGRKGWTGPGVVA